MWLWTSDEHRTIPLLWLWLLLLLLMLLLKSSKRSITHLTISQADDIIRHRPWFDRLVGWSVGCWCWNRGNSSQIRLLSSHMKLNTYICEFSKMNITIYYIRGRRTAGIFAIRNQCCVNGTTNMYCVLSERCVVLFYFSQTCFKHEWNSIFTHTHTQHT